MKAEEFIKGFPESGFGSQEVPTIVLGKVILTESHFNKNKIHIKNCIFDEHFIIQTAILKNSVIFEKCTFRKGIGIVNVTSVEQSAMAWDFSEDFNVSLWKCNIIGATQVSNCSLTTGLAIIQCPKIGSVNVSIKNKINSIEIGENKIDNEIRIYHCDSHLINIHKNTISGDIMLGETRVNEIRIDQNNCDKNIYTRNCDIVSTLVLGNKIKGEVRLSENYKTTRLEVKDNSVSTQFSHTVEGHHKLEQLSVSGGSYGHGFQVGSVNGKSAIDIVSILATNITEGIFTFSNLDIDRINISGTSVKSSLIFDRINLGFLLIKSFFNYSTLSFSNLNGLLKQDNTFEITNSKIGLTEFLNSDLSEFDRVIIHSSSIMSITSVQTKWFRPEALLPFSEENSDTISSKQEIYRQLKYAMEQQGDRIQALEFKREEMLQYKKILRLKPFNQSTKWEEIGNRAILTLNHLSNNFGQNWLRPALLCYLSTCLFYVFITISNETTLSIYPARTFGEAAHTLKLLFSNIHQTFLMIDPTSKISEVLSIPNNEINTSVFIWFFLQKITLTYLIFQTISAFRKYLK